MTETGATHDGLRVEVGILMRQAAWWVSAARTNDSAEGVYDDTPKLSWNMLQQDFGSIEEGRYLQKPNEKHDYNHHTQA